MRRILVILSVTLVVIHCKPEREVDNVRSEPNRDSEGNDYYRKISHSINVLKRQIATLKDTLGKQDDSEVIAKQKDTSKKGGNSLADTVKMIVAEDHAKHSSENKGVSDLAEPRDVPVEDHESFNSNDEMSKDETDFVNNYLDEYDGIVVAETPMKTKSVDLEPPLIEWHRDNPTVRVEEYVPKSTNEGGTLSDNKAEIVVPTLDEDIKETLKEITRKRSMEKKKKTETKNMKDTVLGIRSNFHRMKKAFAGMKNEKRLFNHAWRKKIQFGRSLINNVVDEFKELKDQLVVLKGDDNRRESNDERKLLLDDMKDQLQQALNTIRFNEEDRKEDEKKEKGNMGEQKVGEAERTEMDMVTEKGYMGEEKVGEAERTEMDMVTEKGDMGEEKVGEPERVEMDMVTEKGDMGEEKVGEAERIEMDMVTENEKAKVKRTEIQLNLDKENKKVKQNGMEDMRSESNEALAEDQKDLTELNIAELKDKVNDVIYKIKDMKIVNRPQ